MTMVKTLNSVFICMCRIFIAPGCRLGGGYTCLPYIHLKYYYYYLRMGIYIIISFFGYFCRRRRVLLRIALNRTRRIRGEVRGGQERRDIYL